MKLVKILLFISAPLLILALSGCKKQCDCSPGSSGTYTFTATSPSIQADGITTTALNIKPPSGTDYCPIELHITDGVLIVNGLAPVEDVVLYGWQLANTSVLVRSSTTVDANVQVTLRPLYGPVQICKMMYMPNLSQFQHGTLTVVIDSSASAINPYVEMLLSCDSTLAYGVNVMLTTGLGTFANGADTMTIQLNRSGQYLFILASNGTSGIANVNAFTTAQPANNLSVQVPFTPVKLVQNAIFANSSLTASLPSITENPSNTTPEVLLFNTSPALQGKTVVFTATTGTFIFSAAGSNTFSVALNGAGQGTALWLPNAGFTGNVFFTVTVDNILYNNTLSIVVQ